MYIWTIVCMRCLQKYFTRENGSNIAGGKGFPTKLLCNALKINRASVYHKD